MNTQALRESFEKEHPKPDGESYCPLDNKYRVDGLITSRYHKTNYQCLWHGYQSGCAARQAEVDKLKRKLEEKCVVLPKLNLEIAQAICQIRTMNNDSWLHADKAWSQITAAIIASGATVKENQ